LLQTSQWISKTFLLLPINNEMHIMKKNEEYVKNPNRDWIMFIISTIGMIALLIWLPEWIWVAWPFQFTALAGAMGRL